MTCRGTRLGVFLGFALVISIALMGACSDDTTPGVDGGDMDAGLSDADGLVQQEGGPPPCRLTIAKINGRDAATINQITASDDQDTGKFGIQVDVDVTGTGLADGTDVTLTVTKLVPDRTAKASAGQVSFKGVTIDADLTTVAFKATAAGCSADTVSTTVVPVPECTFVQPKDGASLGKKDDKLPATAPIDYDVIIQTKNATQGQVSLKVGASTVGTKSPDALGRATFTQAFNDGASKLEGTVTVKGVTRSCTSDITVSSSAPKCEITGYQPKAVDLTPPTGKKRFGVAQDASTGTAGLQTAVSATVGANVDQLVVKVNGTTVKTVTGNTSTTPTISGVTLPDGNGVDVQLFCTETKSGNSSKSIVDNVVVDTQLPKDVTDFTCTVTDHRAGDVKCSWTAVADTGSGMDKYLARYVVGSPITATNWGSATPAGPGGGEVTAFKPGVNQEQTISSLELASTYYFGLRSRDKVLNQGAVVADGSSSSGLVVDFKKGMRDALSGAKAWGQTMAGGDFDCDGNWDLAVGAPDDNGGKGKVYIYLGGALNGFPAAPFKIFSGTVAGGNYGARVMGLSNFDGDSSGCSDLAVVASHGGSNKARVYVYLGKKGLSDRDDVSAAIGADLVYQLASGASSAEVLGATLSDAGDFDGDGASDLAVSYTNNLIDTASVFVVYGDKTLTPKKSKPPVVKQLPGSAGVQITGGALTDGFATALACGGKLDTTSTTTDTYSDLLIGARDTKLSGSTAGAAYVVKGGARATTLPETITLGSTTRVATIQGGTSNGALGTAVAFVGDMDGDGTPEFAVSDPTVSSNTGEVYVYNLTGTSTKLRATIKNDVSGAAGDKFGQVLSCAGGFSPTAGADINGDGLADLLVGAETLGSGTTGGVYQIGGAKTLTGLSSSTAGYVWTAPTGAATFGASVLLLEDINSDNYVDVVIGDPGYKSGAGRFHYYF